MTDQKICELVNDKNLQQFHRNALRFRFHASQLPSHEVRVRITVVKFRCYRKTKGKNVLFSFAISLNDLRAACMTFEQLCPGIRSTGK